MPQLTPFNKKRTTSADGTEVGWVEMGDAGPVVVVVHGGNQAHTHYVAFGRALVAHGFRVALPDRRGRGLTPTVHDGDGIDAELADLAAVMDATGARLAFGHSAGGLIVAEAAVRAPQRFDAIALYEPAVDLVGRISFDWADDYAAAVAKKQWGRAFAIFATGLQMAPPFPLWLTTMFAAVLMRTGARDLQPIMPTLLRDVAMARSLTGRAPLYGAIAVRTLVIAGSKTPRYIQAAAAVVAGDHRTIAGADHTLPVGPDAATLAPLIAPFFGAPTTSTRTAPDAAHATP